MKILHDNRINAQGTSKRYNLTIPPRLRPPYPRRPGEQPDAHREHGNWREQYANRNPKDLRDLKRMTRQQDLLGRLKIRKPLSVFLRNRLTKC